MVHFPESHTSENIKRELTKIRVIVQDKGMNMVKGVRETLLPSERCFIHTLQLVINDGIKKQSHNNRNSDRILL